MRERSARGPDGGADTRQVREVLRLSNSYLAKGGVASPRLDAEVILAQVLGLSRLDLYVQFDRVLDESDLNRIKSLLRTRAAGTPLAYITGLKEFFGLPFRVGEEVLIPRPESELLVELGIAAFGGSAQIRCADLGCGSGCVGIALAAQIPTATADGVDLDPGAVEISRRNALANRVSDRLTVFQGSWATPLLERGPYQLILSNPPYVTSEEWSDLSPEVRDHEPRLALDGGADGLDSYRQLLPGIGLIAAPGATILLEGDPRRMGGLDSLCAHLWPRSQRQVHPDLTGRARVLEVRLPG